MRLRYAYILKCERVVKDASGAVTELRCTYDPESLNGATATRRVKGTMHWVSAPHARDAEVRLYDRLFRSPDPGEGGRDPLTDLNPDSLRAAHRLQGRAVGRDGAARDAVSSSSARATSASTPIPRPGAPVFNRTVTLKDAWAKIASRG